LRVDILKKLFSTADLATYFEVSVVTLRMRVLRGFAPKPSVKKGKRVFWTQKDIEDFLKKMEGEE
jgi:hypothetical protein